MSKKNMWRTLSKTKLSLAVLAVLSLALLLARPAQAREFVVEITSVPVVITAPGQYKLATSLTSAVGGPAINIQASDVHLTLAGNTLTGPTNCNSPDPNAPFSIGIQVGAVSNVHINGGTVGGGFTEGIRLVGTTGSQVNGMLVTANCIFGIHLLGANNNRFNTNVVQLNENPPTHCAGYRLDNSHGNVITSNDVVRNGEVAFDDTGIELSGSSNNTIRSNNVGDNIGHGIQLIDNSDGNIVRSNTVTNNRGHGIQVGFGGNGNLIQGNTVTGNLGNGIRLDFGATGNTVQSNNSLGNGAHDMRDDNAACDANTWKSNIFVTDLVAGVGDGGPGVGCIQ